MKLVKSLLLGSAAGIAAVAAAQAADLPSRKAAPAEYVKICDAYGAGFFYIPGTDTCLKVGGYVRAEYLYEQPATAVTVPSWKATVAAPGLANSGSFVVPSSIMDTTGFMARGRVELDARTQTAWGTARTFIGVRALNASGPYSGSDNYQTNTYTGQGGGASITLENAIVQFAGFTFGHTTADILSFVPAEYYSPMFDYGSPAGFNLLSYTATFGGGFSATIGIEDRASQGYPNLVGYTPTGPAGTPVVLPAVFTGTGGAAVPSAAGGAFANGPLTWPVLAGNLRVDQAWGSAQLGAAVMQNSAVSTQAPITGGLATTNNFAVTSTGWGITGGLKFNLPMIGPGDHLYLNAAYANGFLDILASANTTSTTGDLGRGVGGLQRIDRDMYVMPSCAAVTAATMPTCFGTANSTGWSVAGIYDHYWTPTIRSVLLASFVDITPPAAVRATDWTLGGLSEVKVTRISLQPVIWNPVPGLEIGEEISWTNLQQSYTGQNGAAPTPGTAAIPLPAASSNVWQGRIRVTRQF